MSSPLPPPTTIKRSTDPQDPNIWLIETCEGPVFGRLYSDGRRVFYMMPAVQGYGGTAWRAWTDADRPEIEQVWESFTAWWADQGHPWPPHWISLRKVTTLKLTHYPSGTNLAN